MTAKSDSVCKCCGAPISAQEAASAKPDNAVPPAKPNHPDREYDHRGILLPRRTRIGGIIIPQ